MQVAHALSMVTAVEAAIPPEVAAMNQQPAGKAQEAKSAAYGSSAMKTQLRFRISAEVPLIAVLCLVSPIVVMTQMPFIKWYHPRDLQDDIVIVRAWSHLKTKTAAVFGKALTVFSVHICSAQSFTTFSMC